MNRKDSTNTTANRYSSEISYFFIQNLNNFAKVRAGRTFSFLQNIY